VAALVLLAAAAAVAVIERRAAGRRWPGWLLLLGTVLLLPPADALRRRAPAGPPATGPSAPGPNLLLLVWDTTRADRLTPWGHERDTTPNLQRLAADSATWEAAYSASVFTLSSHVSMLTGLPPALHGTSLRRQTVTAPSVARTLRDAGYRTGAFVGTSVLAAGRGLERGFEVYDDLVDPPLCSSTLWALVHDVQVVAAKLVPALRGNGNPNRPQDFQRPAAEVLDAAAAFIARPDPRPWFVMVNLFDVHWPYLPGKDAAALWVRPYDGPVNGYLFRADDFPPGYRPDAADAAHVRDLYDAELWELDRAVDAFLAGVLQRDPQACVLLTSDHGEALGDGDTWSHDELLLPQTRVPLLLRAPGRVEPGRRPGPVSGVDVAATLLDLAGVEPPPGTPSASRSLLAPPDPRRVLFLQDLDNLASAKDHSAALRGRLKLKLKDGVATLTDPLADPLDRQDLSAAHPEEAAALRSALETLLAASAAAGDGDALQNEAALRALGYVGN
jgi:arylsulfatase A-like enzyme